MAVSQIIDRHEDHRPTLNLAVENFIAILCRKLIFPGPDGTDFLSPAFFSGLPIRQVNGIPQGFQGLGLPGEYRADTLLNHK